jgi:metal-responsive CopG/Arc/MetJ family transcriptional regulator
LTGRCVKVITIGKMARKRKRIMTRVTVTVRKEDLEKVDEFAEKLAIPRSAAVRILIMEALEKRAKSTS